MLVKVTEVEHYTDRLFRFKTERPVSFRFAAGEFTMVGIEKQNQTIPKRAYSMTSGPYDDFIEFLSITAAATTGPAKQPLPTSSTPAIIIF